MNNIKCWHALLTCNTYHRHDLLQDFLSNEACVKGAIQDRMYLILGENRGVMNKRSLL